MVSNVDSSVIADEDCIDEGYLNMATVALGFRMMLTRDRPLPQEDAYDLRLHWLACQ